MLQKQQPPEEDKTMPLTPQQLLLIKQRLEAEGLEVKIEGVEILVKIDDQYERRFLLDQLQNEASARNE